jgi:hypothetical protein
MGLKVPDEFTVPLSAGHHDALHKTGDERAWWARHGIIEPLKFAERLWAASRVGSEKGGDLPDQAGIKPEANFLLQELLTWTMGRTRRAAGSVAAHSRFAAYSESET